MDVVNGGFADTHEQVVSGHSRLSGDTGGDDNDLGTLEGRSDAEEESNE